MQTLQLALLTPHSPGKLVLVTFISAYVPSFYSSFCLRFFCLFLQRVHLKGKRNSWKASSSKVFHYICSCRKVFDSRVLEVQLLILYWGEWYTDLKLTANSRVRIHLYAGVLYFLPHASLLMIDVTANGRCLCPKLP